MKERRTGIVYWLFSLSVILMFAAPTIGLYVFGEEYRWWFLALDIGVIVIWGFVFWFGVTRLPDREQRRSAQ